MKTPQRGGTILGIILGIVLGLGAALAVAVYVTKVPVPFMNKGGMRGPEQDEAEAQKNKNWDPNAPLYGKNPARPTGSVPEPVPATAATPPASVPLPSASAPRGAASKPTDAKVDPKADPKVDTKIDTKIDTKANINTNTNTNTKADPLGDLAKNKSEAAGVDPFDYFVQAGAFRSQADADSQRAKLALMGLDARVSEREQNGRTVFRVRVGPFAKRDSAGDLKEKLDGAGLESNLVRVQR